MSANQSFVSDQEALDDFTTDHKNVKIAKVLLGDELFSQSVNEVDLSKNYIFSNNLCDCLNAAQENMREVFKQVDKYIYNRELEKKVGPFCILQAFLLTECSVDMGVSSCDDQEYQASQLEDQEPGKVKIDKWMRAVISVDAVKPIKDSIAKIPQDSDIDSSSSKQSVINRLKKNQQRKSDVNESIIETPTPVNMEQAAEFDEFEERVRVIKQIEYKRKTEMEHQEFIAIQEIKKQQMTMKKDVKGTKFTYDFDGKILNTKTIASEKLPPTNYLVQFQLKEDIVKAKEYSHPPIPHPDDKRNHKLSKEQLLVEKQQQELAQQKELLAKQSDKIKTSSPFEYDSFTPSNGVKLIYQSRFKEGMRYNPEIIDIEQLDMVMKTHKENEPLHITKSDYRRLTENGNLNRNASQQSNGPPTQMTGQGGSQKQDRQQILVTPRIQENSKFIDSSREMGTGRKGNSMHQLTSIQKIKITNPKLVRDLITSVTHEEETIKDKFPKILDRHKSEAQLKASPNDLFNMTLMDDQTWGKGKGQGGGFAPPEQHLSKPTLNDYKKSLNTLYQLPRERDKLQAMKKVQMQMNDQLQRLSRNGSQKSIVLSARESQQCQTNIRQTFYSSRAGFENQLRNSTLGQI